MAQELVWARIGDRCAAVSRAYAKKKRLEVLDESPLDRNGEARRPARVNGRPVKPKTSVAKAAAKKSAAAPAATEETAVPVIGPESASIDSEKETDR